MVGRGINRLERKTQPNDIHFIFKSACVDIISCQVETARHLKHRPVHSRPDPFVSFFHQIRNGCLSQGDVSETDHAVYAEHDITWPDLPEDEEAWLARAWEVTEVLARGVVQMDQEHKLLRAVALLITGTTSDCT